MAQLKVLVVDDSSFDRELISAILQSDPGISVIGEAANGAEALDMVASLSPDILTMDVTMPVMDGIEAIERIMAQNPLPILVVTGKGDADTAFRALSKGALEVIPKGDVTLEDAEDFIGKIKILSGVKVIRHIRSKRSPGRKAVVAPGVVGTAARKVVAIACSTGGPKALAALLPKLPEDFPCPVVIAQHISEDFIHSLAQWLDGISALSVKVGRERDKIAPGNIYLSPAASHMEVNANGRVSLASSRPEDIYHPSCDRLLSSVAASFGQGGIGVILTGMGDDGARGMKAIKEAGGATVAQDEETSIIFGMPAVAIREGSADRVLPLDEIAKEIQRLAQGKEFSPLPLRKEKAPLRDA